MHFFFALSVTIVLFFSSIFANNSLFSYNNSFPHETKSFSTVSLDSYCIGVYPNTYCYEKNTLSLKLASIIENYIENKLDTRYKTSEQKNRSFRRFQYSLEKAAQAEKDDRKHFIFLYAAAILDHHANQHTTFDSCGGWHDFDKEDRWFDMINATYYDQHKNETDLTDATKELDNIHGCISHDKTIFVFDRRLPDVMCASQTFRYNISQQKGSSYIGGGCITVDVDSKKNLLIKSHCIEFSDQSGNEKQEYNIYTYDIVNHTTQLVSQSC